MGSRCFILNSKGHLSKFDPKSNEESFLGYSTISKAYGVSNKKSLVFEESINVTFEESQPPLKYKELVDNDLVIEDILRKIEKPNVNISAPPVSPLEIPNSDLNDIPKDTHVIKDHPLQNVIGNIDQGVLIRS